MNAAVYHLRSLRCFWRANLAVVLGVVVAAATLTGALLVGDSLRGSLRETALSRLGPFDDALLSVRFFREELAAEIADNPLAAGKIAHVCPLIWMNGGARHADSGARVNRVNLLGVDDRFWQCQPADASSRLERDDRSVILNRALADDLGARVGDDVLINLHKPSDVPTETLLGRPEQAVTAIRATVKSIVASHGLGNLELRPQQDAPRNAYLALPILQRHLEQPARINAMLLVRGPAAQSKAGPDATPRDHADYLADLLRQKVTLDDYGLRLRADPGGFLTIESRRMLIDRAAEDAVQSAARDLTAPTTPILTYLANSIDLLGSRAPEVAGSGPSAGEVVRSIPYSTVAAIAVRRGDSTIRLLSDDGKPAPPLRDDDLLLNQWAADDLDAKVGDRIRLEFYESRTFGQISTASADFTLRGIVSMDAAGGDAGLTPEFEGITNAKSLADWDAPFPMDMRRVRDKDERYWDRHRGAPKAFISLARGQQLWTQRDARFGRLTSIRVEMPAVNTPQATAEQALLKHLDPAGAGLRFEPIRRQALAAGGGSTDFGGLFIGFSFFLIAAAAMLIALLLRLNLERRAAEIGLLTAVGLTPRRVGRLMMMQGMLLAFIGAALGIPAAEGYAWLMLAGLRTWWSAAANAPFLRLHVEPTSLLIGFTAGLVVAAFAVWRGVRGLSRMPPRGLLAGITQELAATKQARRPGAATWVAWASLAGGVASVAAAAMLDGTSRAALFFVAGALLLSAALACLSAWLRRGGMLPLDRRRDAAALSFGLRNAARRRGRSVLTAGLVASATFIIVAVGANRHRADDDALRKDGGVGGFSLMAESIVPLQYDLNSPTGRDALNLSAETHAALDGATVYSFRLRTGDDASCLNLYQINKPRILGATADFLSRGGFSFASGAAVEPADRENPWRLLTQTLPDGAIPTIGDANTVQWLLHLGLGGDLPVTDDQGVQKTLRIVGLLSGSVLQGELVMSADNFARLFPSISGYGFFLIDTPAAASAALATALEKDLGDFSFDAQATVDRLNAYLAVENTYLSTFQTLGGLGLALGTLGLAAVMLRNVWERRGELALLRAVGLPDRLLGAMVLTENGFLLLVGIAAGAASALIAVAPNAMHHPRDVPWASLAWTLLGVAAAGMCAGLLAVRSALRTPLLGALRAERL